TGHGIEGSSVQTLMDTNLFARLHELDLSMNASLGDRAARLLAAERSNTLTALDVRATSVTAFGLRQLLQARSWPAMRRLGIVTRLLFPQGFSPAAFEQEWVSRPLAQQLTSLSLVDMPVGVAGLTALLRWEGLSRLEELRLH